MRCIELGRRFVVASDDDTTPVMEPADPQVRHVRRVSFAVSPDSSIIARRLARNLCVEETDAPTVFTHSDGFKSV